MRQLGEPLSARIDSCRDLVVWQQAMELVVTACEATLSWPKEEVYGLTSKVRRAAPSVPANIAERFGRESVSKLLRLLTRKLSTG